jgi:hypothetical protein
MSKSWTVLAFALLFATGYLLGLYSQDSPYKLYFAASTAFDRVCASRIPTQLAVTLATLTSAYTLVLLAADKLAALESQRNPGCRSRSISAREHLRRRGSF